MVEVGQALETIRQTMQAEGLPDALTEQFCRLYRRFRAGDTGCLAWDEVQQPATDDIVDFATEVQTPRNARRGVDLLDTLAVIRLNGGLGTSMALQQAKSLIEVREGRSFLQLIRQQIERMRSRTGARLPLLLMNSFATQADSLRELAGFQQPAGIPLDFLQNKVPRIDAETGLPVNLARAEARWAPPGHGDIYLAMAIGGVWERLLEQGYRWAFVCNADNLGAMIDPTMLGFLDRHHIDFAMEVTPKTTADRKGGTLVRHEGRLTLLERAQVADEHLPQFEDIERFRVFNTNSLWWRLDVLAKRVQQGTLDLPMIVNPKRVEQRSVVQLETAMGAAIGRFERSAGILVSRERFAPVKTTDDLLAVRSDAYVMDEGGGLHLSPERDPALGPPDIRLDARYYKALPAFEQRIAHPPSLVACRRLTIEGDVTLGQQLVCAGEVSLVNETDQPQRVPDGTVLSDRTIRWKTD
jgi:UTP--glucose-1-phosphate uridylyltransferase